MYTVQTFSQIIVYLFQMLDENNQLIQAIIDYQHKGKVQECVQ